MANQTGRPIAPARKLVAAVMGTLAVFVIVFGLGMSSMAVAFFGVAVLALAIVLAVVNVSNRRGGRATVAGSAEVKAIPPAPVSSAYGRADIDAIVVAPGLGTFETVIRESRIPVAKWPALGTTLPITVDVDDTRRVRVNWNDAPAREDGDPPPPAAAEFAPDEEIDDDVLGTDEPPPPWANRDDRDWAVDADEPPPPPQPEYRTAAYSDTQATTPVVVRHTPTGTIVEGQLVDADEEPPPLPRRAKGASRFGRSSPRDESAPESPSASADAGRSDFSTAHASAPDTVHASGPDAVHASGPEADATTDPDPGGFAPGFMPGPSAPTARTSTSRPPGTRPSPKPRGNAGTVTAERPPPSGTPEAPARPPSQRTPADDPPVDLPLDEPSPPDDATTAWAPTGSPPRQDPAATEPDTIAWPAGSAPTSADADPAGSSTSSGRTRFFAQPNDVTDQLPRQAPGAEDPGHPEPTPTSARPAPEPIRTAEAAVPSPVSAPPTAPAPDRPFPSAPPPSAPHPAASPTDDIDIPLDADPEPAPETTPAAAGALADGIIAPPADAIPADAIPADAGPDRPERSPSSPWGDFGGTAEPDEHAADVITAYPSARPGPAGAIHGVGITVLVTDLPRSIAFYRDILGFFEIDSGDSSAVLASGDTRLVLRTVHNLSADAGRLIHLNLEVGDVDSVYEELREKGVKFVHSPRPVNRGDKLELWSATFRDPDNHNIAITQWRAIR